MTSKLTFINLISSIPIYFLHRFTCVAHWPQIILPPVYLISANNPMYSAFIDKKPEHHIWLLSCPPHANWCSVLMVHPPVSPPACLHLMAHEHLLVQSSHLSPGHVNTAVWEQVSCLLHFTIVVKPSHNSSCPKCQCLSMVLKALILICECIQSFNSQELSTHSTAASVPGSGDKARE